MSKGSARIVGAGLVSVTALALLSGCGGNGGGTPITNSPYAGSYVGVGSDVSGNQSTVQFTVGANGHLSGTSAVNGAPTTTLVGVVSNSGSATINGKTVLTGNFSAPSTGPVSAILSSVYVPADALYLVAIQNPTKGGSGGNPFAGQYAGSDSLFTTTLPGLMGLSVDTTGNVHGTMIEPVNGTLVNATVTGTITSAGAINISTSYQGNVVMTASGSVKLSSTALNGALSTSTGDQLTISLITES